jgi:hypothetical protein
MLSALVVLILGLWMVTSPLFIHWSVMASWNSWIVGVIAAIGGVQFQRTHKTWQATLTFIASACIFVAGFIPRLQHRDELIGRSIGFGALLFIAAICAVGYRHAIEHPAPRAR